MADTTALKNRIRAAIKANDNQEITGPVLQQSLLDIVDELNGATETEASQRQNADSTLSGMINSESQQRQNADTALGQRITQEISQERQKAEDAFDDLDMIDAAGSQVSPEAIDLTLRKNDGSEVDPEWRTLCHLLIPSVTNQRAGLMSAAMRNLLYNLRNAGYAFGGIAVPGTNPNPVTANCFYIVRGAGTYTHFKNADNESIIIENDGIYVFTYEAVENNYWEWNSIIGIDDIELIAGSKNLAESSIVKSSIDRLNKLTLDDFAINGMYNSSNGEYSETSSRKLTDYFLVKEGDVINYKIYCNSSQLEVIAFDSSKNVMLASSVSGRQSREATTYTVPSGVSYIRFCEGGSSTHTGEVVFPESLAAIIQSQSTIIQSQYLILPFVTDAPTTRLQVPSDKRKAGFQIAYYNGIEFVVESAIKYSPNDAGWKENNNWKRVEGHNEELYNFMATLYQNSHDMVPLVERWDYGRLSADGSYTASNGFRISNFIEVTAGEVLYILAYSNSANEPTIVCYNSSKVCVGSETGSSTFDGYYTVPNGVSYIKIIRRNSHKNCGVWRGFPIPTTKKYLSIDSLQNLSPTGNCVFLYFQANFSVTNLVLWRLRNASDGFSLFFYLYEPTHPVTTLDARITVSQDTVRTGFYEAVFEYGPSILKVGMFLFGEVTDCDNINVSIPIKSVDMKDDNPINDIFDLNNKIGRIVSNETLLILNWKNGRLDYNNDAYVGWVKSVDYWNSGYITLPAGTYKVTGKTTSNGRAPMIIKYNNDYTFNSILVAGTSTVASYTFTLSEATIVACNTQATSVSYFKLERVNTGSLDICENFTEVDNQLYYKGKPVASESSISEIVTDLPVSDGTGIESGYAYIDITDRSVKVKA